jgi:hypothetical protein
MTDNASNQLRVISRDELKDVRAQARAERWTSLGVYPPDWHDVLRSRDGIRPGIAHVVLLDGKLDDAIDALATLRDLTTLELPGHTRSTQWEAGGEAREAKSKKRGESLHRS